MKLDLSNFQGVVAGLTVGGGTCDLPPRVEVPTRSEPDIELAPLMRKVEAMSIAEIDRLMAGLHELKGYLQSERKRIEREMIRYKNLTKTASASVKTVLDAVSNCTPRSTHENQVLPRSRRPKAIRPSRSGHHLPGHVQAGELANGHLEK